MSLQLLSRFQSTPALRATVLAFSSLICISAAQAQATQAATAQATQAATAQKLVQLPGMRSGALRNAVRLAPLASDTTISAMITLPLRDPKQLDALLTALHDPNSPQYGQYLTPEQFTARFGPTQADYDAVVAFARSKGLAVTLDDTRTFVSIQGRAPVMEAALNLRLNTYRPAGQKSGPASDQTFFAADRAPSLPASIAGKVMGVVGLDNTAPQRPFPKPMVGDDQITGHSLLPGLNSLLPSLTSASFKAVQPQDSVPNYTDGSNPSQGTGNPYTNGFGPQDLRKAYGLAGVPATGKGQVVAIFGLDGFYLNDSTQYKLQYGLPDVPVMLRSVDGYDNTNVNPSAAGEAALDVDMVLALSPEAKSILFYEAFVPIPATLGGPTNYQEYLHILAAVAKDNVASQFNVSYNFGTLTGAETAIEEQLTKQLNAQGITVFASSGDGGVYSPGDSGISLPAGDPNLTAVGGTALFTNADGSYQKEWVWNDFAFSAGGYVPAVPIPSYQQTGISGIPFDTTTNGGSDQYRNLPDVAANASIYPGVAEYQTSKNGWVRDGGTSASAPIWAGFMGTVNQIRAQAGLGRLGFANPALYAIAQLNTRSTVPDATGHLYPYPFAGAFHDVTFGDDNDHTPGDPVPFTAGEGYDNLTGNGSFDGEKMISALCFISGPKYAPPAVPTVFTAVPSRGSVKLTWTAPKGAKGYLLYRTPGVSQNPASIGFLTSLTGTSYVDTAVTSGTLYQYKLMAVGTGGGIFAAPVAATPLP